MGAGKKREEAGATSTKFDLFFFKFLDPLSSSVCPFSFLYIFLEVRGKPRWV